MNRSDVLDDISEAARRLADADRGNGIRSIGELLWEAFGGDFNSHREGQIVCGQRAIVTTSSFSSELAAGQPQLAPAQQRPLFIRDLVPVIPVTTYSVPFVKELNPTTLETSVSAVAEGGTKPDVSGLANFALVSGAPIVPGTLAANISPSRQLWTDAEVFQSYMTSRLQYALLLREETACITGNGEPANASIVGLLHDTSTNTVSPVTGLFATIAKQAGQLASGGVVPTGVMVNASDYYTAVQSMASPSSTAPAPTVIDLLPPIIPSVSVPAGYVITGDYRQGAALLLRDEVNVQVYPQHSTYAAQNAVLVQVEERAAFAVIAGWRFAVSSGVTP